MRGGKAPTAEQKRFHDWLSYQGCFVTSAPACLHHCVGSTAKFNKIHIGQWWVIPLCYEAHQGRHGIHFDLGLFPESYGKKRKEVEKFIFREITTDNKDSRIPEDVYKAIMEYTI